MIGPNFNILLHSHALNSSEGFASQFAKMKRLPGKQRPVPGWASMVSGNLAKILRNRGCSDLTFYVDDFLLVCDSKEECQRQARARLVG